MRGSLWTTDPAHDLKTSLAELMQDLQRAGAVSHSPRAFAPPVRRARQGTADTTNVNLVRRKGIVPALEASQLCGDKNEGSRVQRRSPASEMRDVAGNDVETCAV